MTIKVAVAVIFDAQQRVLIAKRPSHAAHGGQWEFPGGKLEEHESPLAALIREIKEEVGLSIISADFLCEIHHSYGQKEVTLLVYCVTQFQGTAMCCEAQTDLQWVALIELKNYDFPAANVDIIKRLL